MVLGLDLKASYVLGTHSSKAEHIPNSWTMLLTRQVKDSSLCISHHKVIGLSSETLKKLPDSPEWGLDGSPLFPLNRDCWYTFSNHFREHLLISKSTLYLGMGRAWNFSSQQTLPDLHWVGEDREVSTHPLPTPESNPQQRPDEQHCTTVTAPLSLGDRLALCYVEICMLDALQSVLGTASSVKHFS